MKEQRESFSKRCPLCDDTTWIEVRVDKRTCAYRCECYEKEMLNNNNGWKKAGLTLETSKLNFIAFEKWSAGATTMKDLATKYFLNFDSIKEDKKNSLILSGNSGCGNYRKFLIMERNKLILQFY
ncbi:hypothetical protein KPL39_18495 [Clostridium gasigenes]|uniref:hypothetical protein n=1 Tax=Clostridium gasigenes TaxID=94869 RepID=UPI001C0C71E6|nr:hypothetical protein [Clostridium gasigenes]MBU3138220.1 hypothetical protein [Clostridium gasigenes]